MKISRREFVSNAVVAVGGVAFLGLPLFGQKRKSWMDRKQELDSASKRENKIRTDYPPVRLVDEQSVCSQIIEDIYERKTRVFLRFPEGIESGKRAADVLGILKTEIKNMEIANPRNLQVNKNQLHEGLQSHYYEIADATLKRQYSDCVYEFAQSVRDEIYNYVNFERRNYGLAGCSIDHIVEACAEGHSVDMVLRDFYSHDTPDGVGLKDRLLRFGVRGRFGENIHQPYSGKTSAGCSGHEKLIGRINEFAQAVVKGWMCSLGHKENILLSHANIMGVGVALDKKIYSFYRELKVEGEEFKATLLIGKKV